MFWALVRCGDVMHIGSDHCGVVSRFWGNELGYDGNDNLLKNKLIDTFGIDNIDMGLIVRRSGGIEFGGRSKFFDLPIRIETVRPTTIERIKVLYPDDKVIDNINLRRPN